MELARHHDADLSFGRHAHTRLEDLSKVVDRLPDLWLSHTLPASAVSEGRNGTTPNHRESSPERSQVDPSGHTDRCQRPTGRVKIGPVAFWVPKSSLLSWSTSASVDLLA
jgi:hypothetical protein